MTCFYLFSVFLGFGLLGEVGAVRERSWVIREDGRIELNLLPRLPHPISD